MTFSVRIGSSTNSSKWQPNVPGNDVFPSNSCSVPKLATLAYFFQLLDGVRECACLKINKGKICSGAHEVGVQFEGSAICRNRLVIPAVQVEDPSEIRIRDRRKGIRPLREPNLIERFLQAPHYRKRIAIPVARRVVAGIQFERLLELMFGAVPVPIVVKGNE